MMGRRMLGLDSLAKACGVEVSTVSRWRAGQMLPRRKNIAALARAFQIPEDDVRAALDGGDPKTIREWNKHLRHIQDEGTWVSLWRVALPAERAIRFFDLVEDICSQKVDFGELQREAKAEPTIRELIDAMMARAATQMEPETLAELASLVENLHAKDADGAEQTEGAPTPSERIAVVVAWLLANMPSPAVSAQPKPM